MSIAKFYTEEIKSNLSYLPTWLPTIIAQAGDVGRITDTGFEKETDLKSLNIEFETEENGVNLDFDYTSEGVNSTELNLEGKVTNGSPMVKVNPQFNIEFKNANTVFFKATKCTSTIVKNKIKLGQIILEKYNKGEWDQDLVVVTESVKSTGSTILISQKAGASITLSADGSMGVQTVDFANINLGLKIVHDSNMAVKIIADAGLTPLFKISGIKKRLFRSTQFRSTEKHEDQARFVDVDYEDFISWKPN